MDGTRISNLWGKITILFVICCCSISTKAKYGGGTGEPNDPYLICTAEHMNAIGADSNDWDKHFKLIADVNLAAYTGTQFKIIGNGTTKFTGVFDGKDHKVWNFTWDSTGSTFVGLFGYVGEGGQIKNLGMENVDVNAVDGRYVGGLAGDIYSCVITNCYCTGYVSGSRYVGGLVGFNYRGAVWKCYAKAYVAGSTYVGGFEGCNSYGDIAHCYATGDVNAVDEYAGGFIGGTNSGGVANCYARGNVTGGSYVGGLIGYNSASWDSSPRATIDNSYAAGSVSGTGMYIGGLVGHVRYSDIRYCYFLDPADGGGPDNGHGTALTDAQMRQNESFIGFDFWGEASDGTHEIWFMPLDGGYPILSIYEGFSPHSLQGDGTCGNPYLVTDVWDLGVVHYEPNACYEIANDIELAGTTWYIAPVPEFRGVLDGNNHKISNLNVSGYDYLGLVGKVTDPCASFSDIFLEDVNIAGGSYLGGLIGDSRAGIIINCSVTGCVRGGYNSSCLGGLVGRNYRGSINVCNADIFVSGGESTEWIGGLVGHSEDGRITNCHTTGSVTGEDRIGGLVGMCVSGNFSDCSSTVNVSGEKCVGGLIGYNDSFYSPDEIGSIIKNCYASGSVEGTNESTGFGGLVGFNRGRIAYCYAIGPVTVGRDSDSIGGLAGSNGGEISQCYSTGPVIGGTYDSVRFGGLVGDNGGTIADCYARGSVTVGRRPIYIGGLAGYDEGIVRHCYAAGSVNVGDYADYLGGLIGLSTRDVNDSYFLDPNDGGGPINGHGTPLTEEQMREQVNFGGFDFLSEAAYGTHEIWTMPVEGGYPQLGYFAGIVPHEPAGSGTAADPYLIMDVYDLGAVTYRPYACYELLCDINLARINWCVSPIPEFAGVFEGGGHVISNLSVKGYDYLGLFGSITDPCALVTDLCLESVNIVGRDLLGGFAGINRGTISNCCMTGEVTGGDTLGGFAGYNYYGSFINCYVSGDITGNYDLGGIVGFNSYGNITNCHTTGNVSGSGYAGGMAGTNKGTVLNCWATGPVSGTENYLGGLVGFNLDGSISKCYATGPVSGSRTLGGLVGQHYTGSISDCYAIGSVTGNSGYVGGFVGFHGSTAGYASYITNCYSTGPVEGSGLVGGFCGSSNGGRIYNGYFLNTAGPDNREGEPLTEAEMKQQDSFVSWDFNDVWHICETTNYPKLIWQMPSADFLCPDGVNFFDFSFFAGHWQKGNCGASNDCDGTDLDLLGTVDIKDLRIFLDNWLRGF